MNVRLFRVEPILRLVAQLAATLRAWRCAPHLSARGHAVQRAVMFSVVMTGALCGMATLSRETAAADAGMPVVSASASASTPVSDTANVGTPLIDFDIPAQALEDALNQFGLLSGRSALFRSKLVAGLQSRPVHGSYAPATALRLMLDGTRLDVKEASEGSIAALIIVPRDAQAIAAGPASADNATTYDAWIQTRVWEAICANARTATSNYRSLLRFGVDPGGKLSNAHLLTSSGNRRRDDALLEVLQHVRIDRAPPPELAQPLTMLILPGRDGGPVCEVR